MFQFKNLGHAIAHVAEASVSKSRAVADVLGKIQGSEALVENVTTLVDPSAVPIERAGYAALGIISSAIATADSAAVQKGLNIGLDAEAVTAFKSIEPAILILLKKAGINLGKPTAAIAMPAIK